MFFCILGDDETDDEPRTSVMRLAAEGKII